MFKALSFVVGALFFTPSLVHADAGVNTMEMLMSQSYQVTVTEVSAQRALVVKNKVKVEMAGEAIGAALEKVGAYLGKRGVEPVGAPFTRTFSHADGELVFEAGFPVGAAIDGEGDVVAVELPKATVATTMHVGPQDGSEHAYAAIHAWMAKHGKTAAGAPWETYLTDPATTPESQAKMQVFYPIR